MDYRPNRLFTHPDEIRSSSSFSSQRWPRISLAHSHPVVETTQQANPCHYESTLDDSTRTYRPTALRHLNGNPRPLSWNRRQPPSQAGARPSTSPSQPVLVRAYSGGPDDTAGTSRMSLRRSFPFTGRTESQRRGPELPSDKDFSIDGILRAIEPNIRHTLDSIGEICGRSKLSLANEYGSHIAPLGEIRVPPGGLMPVDEASSEHERQANENVVIYDDNHSVMDGRDHSLVHFGFMENTRQSTTSRNAGSQLMLPLSGGDGSSVQVHPDTSSSMGFSATVESASAVGPLPTAREIASRPKSCGRALLANSAEPSTEDHRRLIQTPALVSEVILDVQADGRHLEPGSYVNQNHPTLSSNLNPDAARSRWILPAAGKSALTDVFGWLKYPARDRLGFGQTEQTAEMRLRAMLERQQNLDASTAHADNT
ncbi:hypothetical protein ETB97_004075 [Aspergillus alliaceus]|uniref:Uncharacterized protein n=1 Tax=Petromyces alliaceus TaxID=209559 RepID=A0A8H6AH07_PETAA|nr:hypothetical protein ETB97_004075 [Aspergillus burnettii]